MSHVPSTIDLFDFAVISDYDSSETSEEFSDHELELKQEVKPSCDSFRMEIPVPVDDVEHPIDVFDVLVSIPSGPWKTKSLFVHQADYIEYTRKLAVSIFDPVEEKELPNCIKVLTGTFNEHARAQMYYAEFVASLVAVSPVIIDDPSVWRDGDEMSPEKLVFDNSYQALTYLTDGQLFSNGVTSFYPATYIADMLATELPNDYDFEFKNRYCNVMRNEPNVLIAPELLFVEKSRYPHLNCNLLEPLSVVYGATSCRQHRCEEDIFFYLRSLSTEFKHRFTSSVVRDALQSLVKMGILAIDDKCSYYRRVLDTREVSIPITLPWHSATHWRMDGMRITNYDLSFTQLELHLPEFEEWRPKETDVPVPCWNISYLTDSLSTSQTLNIPELYETDRMDVAIAPLYSGLFSKIGLTSLSPQQLMNLIFPMGVMPKGKAATPENFLREVRKLTETPDLIIIADVYLYRRLLGKHHYEALIKDWVDLTFFETAIIFMPYSVFVGYADPATPFMTVQTLIKLFDFFTRRMYSEFLDFPDAHRMYTMPQELFLGNCPKTCDRVIPDLEGVEDDVICGKPAEWVATCYSSDFNSIDLATFGRCAECVKFSWNMKMVSPVDPVYGNSDHIILGPHHLEHCVIGRIRYQRDVTVHFEEPFPVSKLGFEAFDKPGKPYFADVVLIDSVVALPSFSEDSDIPPGKREE